MRGATGQLRRGAIGEAGEEAQENRKNDALYTYVVISKRHHLQVDKPFTGLRLGGRVLLDTRNAD